MKKLQKKYRELLEITLQFLWGEWSSIGVAGSIDNSKTSKRVIDPEPLVLFSLSVCRYDPRLYDEIMDWLNLNGQFINIQRLIKLQKKYQFNSGPQISAAAEFLSKKKEYRLKWEKLTSLYKSSELENLFSTISGKELPVKKPDPVFLKKGIVRNTLKLRGYSSEFPTTGIPSLLLRMRALFGVNSRAEIITLLGSQHEIFPAEAARQAVYEKRSVQSVLIELQKSGILESYSSGKEKYYRLKQETVKSLLPDSFIWANLAPAYKGLEIILSGLRNSQDTEDMLILSSNLRRYSKEASDFFNESSSGLYLSDSSRCPGEKYIDLFIDDIDRIKNVISGL